MKNTKKFSVVIPTKNRFEDLKKNIASIIKQEIKPDELLIIDQSDKDYRSLLKKNLKNKINLKYFHKNKIKSLTEAKNFSLLTIQNNIIFFLEDDIILKKNFFRNMLKVFENKNILGVCGILINEKKINFKSKIYNLIFLNGVFKDKRPFLWNYKGKEKFIYSKKISGGISAWRKHVFKKVSFDKKNKFHLFEDVDFSHRVNMIWPHSTGILTSAKVVHKWSHINRKKEIELIELKIIEAYKFYKKNFDKINSLELFIFIFGQFLNCFLKSITHLNLFYLKNFIKTILSLKKIKIYSK